MKNILSRLGKEVNCISFIWQEVFTKKNPTASIIYNGEILHSLVAWMREEHLLSLLFKIILEILASEIEKKENQRFKG